VATHVNKITKTQNNLKNLTGFDDNVSGFPGKMVDSMQTREYVRDENLSQIIPDEINKGEQKRHVYLFNDLLVLTKPVKNKKKEQFKDMYNTSDIIDVIQMEATDTIPPHTLQVQMKDNITIILCCGTAGALRNWMNDLKPKGVNPQQPQTDKIRVKKKTDKEERDTSNPKKGSSSSKSKEGKGKESSKKGKDSTKQGKDSTSRPLKKQGSRSLKKQNSKNVKKDPKSGKPEDTKQGEPQPEGRKSNLQDQNPEGRKSNLQNLKPDGRKSGSQDPKVEEPKTTAPQVNPTLPSNTQVTTPQSTTTPQGTIPVTTPQVTTTPQSTTTPQDTTPVTPTPDVTTSPTQPPGKSVEERIKDLEDVLKGLGTTLKSLKRRNNNYKKREKEMLKTIEEMKKIFGNIADVLPAKKTTKPKNNIGVTPPAGTQTPTSDNTSTTNAPPTINTPTN